MLFTPLSRPVVAAVASPVIKAPVTDMSSCMSSAVARPWLARLPTKPAVKPVRMLAPKPRVLVPSRIPMPVANRPLVAMPLNAPRIPAVIIVATMATTATAIFPNSEFFLGWGGGEGSMGALGVADVLPSICVAFNILWVLLV